MNQKIKPAKPTNATTHVTTYTPKPTNPADIAHIYLARQKKLMLKLAEKHLANLVNSPNSANSSNQEKEDPENIGIFACVTAGKAPNRSLDVDYNFHSNPNFLYLTGFHEPEAVLCLLLKNKTLYRFLFCLPKNPERELWDGKRTGVEDALKIYLEGSNINDVANVDKKNIDKNIDKNIKNIENFSFAVDELPAMLEKLLLQSQYIYAEMGDEKEIPHHQPLFTKLQQISEKIAKQLRPSKTLHYFADIRPTLHRMRLIKDAHEIELMRKAAEISVTAHCAAMQKAQVGKSEAQLAAILAYHFQDGGAAHVAYPSIVATGENTCILHHHASPALLKEGDLVLIDAGCEYQGYAADITRTFPANGQFNEAQKEIYEIVYNAHHAAIAAAKAGANFSAPHQAALKVIILGLMKLGLLFNDSSKKEEAMLAFHLENKDKTQNYTQFFMHRTSHYLGMDVHDVGSYQQNAQDVLNQSLEKLEKDVPHYFKSDVKDIWADLKKTQQEALLESGMVITIEPGIYIRPQPHIPEKYWHIGIRLENDILINGDQPINLTEDLPLAWQEIEDLMSGSNEFSDDFFDDEEY